MPIDFTCPHCGFRTTVADQYAGQSGPCANCGKMVTVPPLAGQYAPPAKSGAGISVGVIVLIVLLVMAIPCGGILMLLLWRGGYSSVEQRAKVNAARAQVAVLKTPLEMFNLQHGAYPPSLEWLWVQPPDMTQEQWGGPYLTKPLPLDPWGCPYQYAAPGNHNPDSYDLWSTGPDGVSGTEDDIGNWPSE